jgi:hypothetical protein
VPLDPKSAAGLDVDEWLELSLFRNHVSIAANTGEVAPGKCEKKARRKKLHLHKIVYLVVGRRYRPLWIQKSCGDRDCGSEGIIVKSTVAVSSPST